MSLEEYTPDLDSSESSWQSPDTIKEVSEKFKESVKKGQAWIKKTKKDEKKAKKHDLMLANFLVKIIINKEYDILLDDLFKSLDSWYPSNFILGILSLINIEISEKIREMSGREIIIFNYKKLSEETVFDDNNLNQEIKNRINFWVEDITDIVSIEYSHVLTEKLVKSIKSDDSIILFTSNVFSFFLKELNINISSQKAISISEFILSEILSKIKTLEIENI